MLKKLLHSKLVVALLAVGVAVEMNSCVKEMPTDMGKVGWNPSLAVPVLDASLGFEDVLSQLDSTFLVKNSDQTLKLVYSSDLFSQSAEGLFDVPNQSIRKGFSLNSGEIAVYQAVKEWSFADSQTVSFPMPNGAEINHLEMKQGNLSIRVRSLFKDSIVTRISIPSLKKNNIGFTSEFNMVYNPTTGAPLDTIINVDLNGYIFELSGAGATSNQFTTVVDFSMKYKENGTSTSDSLSFEANISNLKFSFLDGYVGNIPIELPNDSVLFDMFKNTVNGRVYFADPKVDLIIRSSFGVPVKVTFNKFDAVYKDNKSISIATIDTTILGPANRLAGPYTTTLSINNTKAIPNNLDSVLANIPQKIRYSISGSSNPYGKQPELNFITDTSKIRVSVHTELPLYGSLKGFAIQDTMVYSSLDQGNIDKIDYVRFKVITSNGFPTDIDLQLYFVDSAYNKIDSLMTGSDRILNSAIPNGKNKAVPSLKTTFAQVSAARFNKLNKAKFILIRSKLETYKNGTENVYFFADSRIGVKVGMVTKLKSGF